MKDTELKLKSCFFTSAKNQSLVICQCAFLYCTVISWPHKLEYDILKK